MKAYLLAAGYATRMFPLTRDRPKPLLEVAGAPILSHILDRVLALRDLSEVVVIANHRFADAFGRWADQQQSPVPVRVLDDGSTDDGDKLGAIGDLAFALQQVPVDGEDWIVAAGDNLLGFSLESLERDFLERGRPLLAVRSVKRDGPSKDNPSKYNEVVLTPDGIVESFREKPPDPHSDLVAIALYFFPAEVAGMLAAYLAEGRERDAPGHFIAWLVGQTEVVASELPGSWFDIGSLEGLERARRLFRPV